MLTGWSLGVNVAVRIDRPVEKRLVSAFRIPRLLLTEVAPMNSIISRTDATSAGLTHYFTGEPCKHGHLSPRYVRDGKCSTCVQDRVLAHKIANPEMVKETSRRYHAVNRDDHLAAAKIYRESNPEKVAAAKKRCYERTKVPKPRVYVLKPKAEKIESANKYFRERRKRDPIFKLSAYTRNMLRRVLRATGDVKKGSTRDILGYGGVELKSHIESLFTDGMSWENYGEWHIDHKIPISLMTLYGIDDPAIINTLTNLQPMWAIDNLVKGNRSVCQ